MASAPPVLQARCLRPSATAVCPSCRTTVEFSLPPQPYDFAVYRIACFSCLETVDVPIAASARPDPVALRNSLEGPGSAEVDVNFAAPEDGKTALHAAVASASIQCVEILLRQPKLNIDAIDSQGNTALHIAASSRDHEFLRVLLGGSPDLFIKNNLGQRPCDVAQDPQIESLLQERMTASKNAEQWKRTQLDQLENELPSDPAKLKELCVDVLVNQSVFEERCKEAIRQLIEEKHVVLYKNKLLEQAAGIPDKETGDRYLSQLQYWQDETERQTGTINYLKLRIQVLETTASQQEEYYKNNLAEITRQQKDQIQAIFKRAEETERAFLSYQKKHTEELAKFSQARTDQATAAAAQGDNKAVFSQMNQMQEEILDFRKQLGEAQAEHMMTEERLKFAENLKAVAENETQNLRRELDKLRKSMTEKVISQIQEVQQEQNKKDEKDESLGEIVFIKSEGGQKVVKAGTIEKLVERLVDPSAYDNHYMQAFLLTHSIYMDSKDLLDMMVKICRDATAAAKSAANTNGQPTPTSPVVLRIVNTLKYWIEQYWADFQANSNLLQSLTNFADSIESQKLAQMLRTCITRKITGTEAPVIEMPTQYPKPILPKTLMKRFSSDVLSNSRDSKVIDQSGRPISAPWTAFKKSSDQPVDSEVKIKLHELDPLEVARQMTIIEFELFNAIKSREFLDLAWMKDDKETRAPNIIRMVRWSNHIVHWLVSEIVTIKDNVRQRATMMEKVIAVAQNLERLNNFNGVKEVLAALQSSSVHRLKKTKEIVGGKFLKAYEELKKLTSSELNYKILRAKVHAVEPPLIPFPGVYQGDLVFLETCGKTKIDGNLINFQKFQKIASYVLELQTYQRTPYQLYPVTEIQEFIKGFPTLDDDQAYGLSLICEPR